MFRTTTIRNMKKWVAASALLAFLPVTAVAQETEPGQMVIDVPQATSPDDLLEKVRQGFVIEKDEDRRRVIDFERRRDEQAQMLADAKAREGTISDPIVDLGGCSTARSSPQRRDGGGLEEGDRRGNRSEGGAAATWQEAAQARTAPAEQIPGRGGREV